MNAGLDGFRRPPETIRSVASRGFMNSDGRNEFIAGIGRRFDRRNGSSFSRRSESSGDDVYAFGDVDRNLSDRGFNEKEDRFDGTFATPASTIAKKIQILKPLNGFVPSGKNSFNNGVYKLDGEKCSRESLHGKPSSPQEVARKVNKDVYRFCNLSSDYELECDSGPNRFTKNSINSFTNKPVDVQSGPAFRTKKLADITVKRDIKKETTVGYAPARFSHNAFQKIPSKNSPSGKSNASAAKNGRGRGPALHEALQRITPPSIFAKSNNNHWHAPGTDTFDCGPMNSNDKEEDSDSDDDNLYPWVDSWSDTFNISEDRSTRVRKTRDNLRKKIAHLERLEKMISSSKSTVALYNAIKLQLNQNVDDGSARSFRLKGPAVDLLLSNTKLNHILSSSDRKRLRKAKKLPAPVECAHPECNISIMAPLNLCSIHMHHNQEQKLFSTPNCALGITIKDEPISDDKLSNIYQYMNYDRTPESSSKHSPRKRLKTFDVTKSQTRNHKKILPNLNSHNSFQNLTKNNYNSFSNGSHYFPSDGIDDSVTSVFLNHDDTSELNVCSNSSAYESSEDIGIDGLSGVELIGSENHNHHIVDPDVVAEVLALHESGELPLELPPPEPPQENNLDLSAVFNDFFTEHNGEYIPTREETEELERALQAVQNVKSMEKVSSSQHSSLLDSLLDEKDLADTLASLPDVFSSIPSIKAPNDNGAELSSLSS